MPENKTKTPVPPVLNLPHPDTLELDIYTRVHYLEFIAEVYEQVPKVLAMTDEDVRQFLSDAEYTRLLACRDELNDWTRKCQSNKDMNSTMRILLNRFPSNSQYDLIKLLKEVFQRKLDYLKKAADEEQASLAKAAKEKQAILEREDFKRRLDEALTCINPPLEDAKKYLSATDNLLFLEGVSSAIDAYLRANNAGAAGDWRHDPGALFYWKYFNMINECKQEEARGRQIELSRLQAQMQLESVLRNWKRKLISLKKPAFAYPALLAKYQPHVWRRFEVPNNPKGRVPRACTWVNVCDGDMR